MVTLRELTDVQPLSRGLAELVAYLDLGSSRFHMEVLDFMQDGIRWTGAEEESDIVEREATMQRVLFLREDGMSEQADTRFDPEVSPVLIALLKGVIYREGELNLWTTLLRLRVEVGEFGMALGLTLQVDEAEGYAFLRSPANDAAEQEHPLPRLVPRRQLTYYDSLLLALLRRKLAEFDASGTENRLVLRADQMFDLAALFLPEHPDEVRLRTRIGASAERLRDDGFLRKLKSTGSEDTFEMMRIIKAFVDAQLNGDAFCALVGSNSAFPARLRVRLPSSRQMAG